MDLATKLREFAQMLFDKRPAILLLLLWSLSGCTKNEPGSMEAEVLPTAQSLDSSVAAEGYDVSNEDATAFARKWERAMSNHQATDVNKLFDWDGLYKRVSGPLNLGARERSSFEQEMRQADVSAQISSQISSACDSGGSYKFVRLVRRDGVFHAVFRFQHPLLGINYHDLRIVRNGGTVVADRMFVAVTGEELADTFKALMLPLLKSQASSAMSPEKKEELEAFESIIEMLNSARDGDFPKTKRLHKSLPARYQSSKAALLAMIMATSDDENTDEYLAVIDRYSASYPNDPSLGLILFDAGILREDWELFETSRKQIQAWTGGDDFIDLLVAALLAKAGMPEQATALSKDIDPATLELAAAHDYKMVVALATNDYATVLEQLLVLRDKYELEISGLEDDPDFAGFCQSPEYQKWIAS